MTMLPIILSHGVFSSGSLEQATSQNTTEVSANRNTFVNTSNIAKQFNRETFTSCRKSEHGNANLY